MVIQLRRIVNNRGNMTLQPTSGVRPGFHFVIIPMVWKVPIK